MSPLPFRQGEASGEIPSAFLTNQRRNWSDTHAALIVSNRRQFISSVASWCVTALAVGYAGHVASQSKIEPFVVAVDGIGAPVHVGMASPGNLRTERNVRYQLDYWVTCWRQVTSDPVVQHGWAQHVTDMLDKDSQAYGALVDWYKAHNPYKRASTELVTVTGFDEHLAVGDSSWNYQWQEEIRSPQGSLEAKKLVVATISLRFGPLSDANPEGIFVHILHWQESII
jgi:type IV secretory pathway TrbF-like protein